MVGYKFGSDGNINSIHGDSGSATVVDRSEGQIAVIAAGQPLLLEGPKTQAQEVSVREVSITSKPDILGM